MDMIHYCSVTVDFLSTLKVAVPMGSWLVCYIPTGSPTSSSSSSSFCFNEAPGRFWKALELNAVHPVQTAASSSVPASLDQTLLCLLHTAPSPRQLQTGRDRVLLKTGLWFQQMSRHTGNRNARLWSVYSVTLCGSDPQATRFIYYQD